MEFFLLNVHNPSDVRHIEVHEVITIAKLKKYKLPGSEEIPTTDSSRRQNITVCGPQTH
jgi:hypothetical protein